MEVRFQFNGKEYLSSVLKDYIGSEKFKKNLLLKCIVYIALVVLFALRIRYRRIRYIIMIAGAVLLFFMKRIEEARLKRELARTFNIKNDDVRVMHIILDDSAISVKQVMEESRFTYEAVKEAYVMGEYLYIKFISNHTAFVHSRAFKDADSARNFVEFLERKIGKKVYRKKDEKVR